MNNWEQWYRPNREHILETLQRMFQQEEPQTLTTAIADNFNEDVRRN